MHYATSVRTTLDIDDDVLQAAKELARSEQKTAGQVISDLARKALAERVRSVDFDPVLENGWHVLPAREGPMITAEAAQRLIDEGEEAEARLA
jgi:hypothetical protein